MLEILPPKPFAEEVDRTEKTLLTNLDYVNRFPRLQS